MEKLKDKNKTLCGENLRNKKGIKISWHSFVVWEFKVALLEIEL